MISELNPIQYGARPPIPIAAANVPDLADIRQLAEKMTVGLLPKDGPGVSPPGTGSMVDVYDTVGMQGLGLLGGGKSAETLANILNGDFAQSLSTAEPAVPPPDFPYLKPLGPTLGQFFDSLV
jgi:hypothetical protein